MQETDGEEKRDSQTAAPYSLQKKIREGRDKEKKRYKKRKGKRCEIVEHRGTMQRQYGRNTAKQREKYQYRPLQAIYGSLQPLPGIVGSWRKIVQKRSDILVAISDILVAIYDILVAAFL